MSTILFPSPVFGPVSSRRLGVSLGVNLLPEDGKVCSFDCIYCECGLRAGHRPTAPMPTRAEVAAALEDKLRRMADEGVRPDVITFAGNGEPTMHPDFADIVDDTVRLRDRLAPEARISVLSNSTRMGQPGVTEALLRTDNPIMKLDTVDAAYIGMVNRPAGHYDVREVVERLRAAGPQIVVQTMFLAGTADGRSVDNTGEAYVEPWLRALEHIGPREVMIYTIARETPLKTLRKAPAATLDAIAQRVRALGLKCGVSY